MTPPPPKVPHACCVCDAQVRAYRPEDLLAAPPRGPRLPGTRTALLTHRDGTWSEHSLCATCTLSPDLLPTLWARVLALAVQSVRPAQRPALAPFATNVPLGVLGYTEAQP